MGLDDFLDKFNLLSRVQGAVWSLGSYLPHRASHKGRKVGPWRIDGGTREIHVDRWHTTGGQAERILKRVAIPIAGRRITSREAIFIVRERQAAWAEYNLLRAGAALGPGHVMIDPDNVRRAGQYNEAVPAWARRDLEAEREQEDPEPQPSANATSGKNAPEKRGKRLLRELW